MHADPRALLRRHMGFDAFRPGQEELVRAVLAGRDALGVLPTGGGKSVCYQVPALALGGSTLVVTPLVSLMEDQVRRALAVGLRAAHLSAAQSPEVRAAIERRLVEGDLDLLLVAPERLESPAFQDLLRRARIRLIAIDEAHCISEWGHDFRPSYRRLGLLRRIASAPVLALTASATPSVRSDIQQSLGLIDPCVVVRSFDRPNLRFSVRRGGSFGERTDAIHARLRRRSGSVIVYAPTRRVVDLVRDRLASLGVKTEGYHAGLPGPERSRVQDSFMGGRCRVVVATNAFGMGIDKADVRLVAHLQLPATLEAYYQEAGRAGRDGGPSECIAYHAKDDRTLARAFVDGSQPPVRVLERLHSRLWRLQRGKDHLTLDAETLRSDRWGSGGPPDERVLAALVRLGAVALVNASVPPRGTHAPPSGSLGGRIRVSPRLDTRSARMGRRVALSKLRAVERYATARGCRRGVLLRYFGETASGGCAKCDRCCPSSL